MFAPGAQALVAEFGITSSVVASLTVSIYILGFAVGPLFLASMSETYGRLLIYHLRNAVYIAFTIGCALSTNTAMFLVFRFICGCAASSPPSMGGGTIADLHTEAERGKAMALFGLGPFLVRWVPIRSYIDTTRPSNSEAGHWSHSKRIRHSGSRLALDVQVDSDSGKAQPQIDTF